MILTLDIAFRNAGWAIIDNDTIIDTGVIRTKKVKNKLSVSENNINTINYIVYELDKILDKYPEISYINGELSHGGSQSAISANQLGMAFAIIVTYVNLKKIPSKWCSPNAVKKVVCGKLKAEKEEIIEAITKLYPDYKFPKAKCLSEHICDAIGAYLAIKNKG